MLNIPEAGDDLNKALEELSEMRAQAKTSDERLAAMEFILKSRVTKGTEYDTVADLSKAMPTHVGEWLGALEPYQAAIFFNTLQYDLDYRGLTLKEQYEKWRRDQAVADASGKPFPGARKRALYKSFADRDRYAEMSREIEPLQEELNRLMLEDKDQKAIRRARSKLDRCETEHEMEIQRMAGDDLPEGKEFTLKVEESFGEDAKYWAKAGEKATAAVKDAFKDESGRGKRGAFIPAGEIAEALGVPANYPDLPELPDYDPIYELPPEKRARQAEAHPKRYMELAVNIAVACDKASTAREVFLKRYENTPAIARDGEDMKLLRMMHKRAARLWRDYVEQVCIMEDFPLEEDPNQLQIDLPEEGDPTAKHPLQPTPGPNPKPKGGPTVPATES